MKMHRDEKTQGPEMIIIFVDIFEYWTTLNISVLDLYQGV